VRPYEAGPYWLRIWHSLMGVSRSSTEFLSWSRATVCRRTGKTQFTLPSITSMTWTKCLWIHSGDLDILVWQMSFRVRMNSIHYRFSAIESRGGYPWTRFENVIFKCSCTSFSRCDVNQGLEVWVSIFPKSKRSSCSENVHMCFWPQWLLNFEIPCGTSCFWTPTLFAQRLSKEHPS
jgi:hypothetical protein